MVSTGFQVQCEARGIGDCVTIPVLEPGLNVIRSNLWHQGDKKFDEDSGEGREESAILLADSEFPFDSLSR